MESSSRKFTAPYLPWKTFFNLLERMEQEGTPDRIDRSYLPTLSGNDQSYLMSALKTLGLTDPTGRVLPAIEPLRSKETRPGAVRSLLDTFYPEAVALPQNATQAQLDEVFRTYGVQGDAARKAQTFFLRAADYAGLTLSKNFKNPAAAPGEGGRATGRPRTTRRRTPRTPDQTPPPDPGAVKHEFSSTPIPVHPMLSGSITWLSEKGPSWSETEAEAWISAFTMQVRLVYPTTKAKAPASRRTPTTEGDKLTPETTSEE